MGNTWAALMKRGAACWISLEKPENRVPDPGEAEGCRGWELIMPDFMLTPPMNVKRTTFWQEKNACLWGMIKSCNSSGWIVQENPNQTICYSARLFSCSDKMASESCKCLSVNQDYFPTQILRDPDPGSRRALKRVSRISQSMASFLWNSIKSHHPALDPCPILTAYLPRASPLLALSHPPTSATSPLPPTAQRENLLWSTET